LRAPGLREALDSDLKSLSPSFEHVELHVAALFTANPRADPMSMRKPNFLNTAKATLPTIHTFTCRMVMSATQCAWQPL
jgi:hypothetical protein